jgi:hypothetical protein
MFRALPYKSFWAISLAAALPGTSFSGISTAPLTPEAPVAEVAAPNVSTPQAPAAFQEGEHLTFIIKWGLVTGGYSSLKVQNTETIDGRPTYHVVAEAKSTGMVDTFYRVRDRNEAWIDPQAPHTLRYARNIREGKYRLEEQVVLDRQARKFRLNSYRADKKRHKVLEGDIPANVLDVLGSLYHVRTLPLEVGKQFTIDVHSGKTVYPLVVKVTKRQKVKVKAGKFDCFVVEPQLREPGIFVAKGKKLEVFMTADARRMPVMMRSEIFIGHVAAELVSHRSVPPVETYKITKGETDMELDPTLQTEAN